MSTIFGFAYIKEHYVFKSIIAPTFMYYLWKNTMVRLFISDRKVGLENLKKLKCF